MPKKRPDVARYLGPVSFKPTGHPVLSQKRIIKIAGSILKDFEPICLTSPGIVSMPSMIDWLRSVFGVTIEIVDLSNEGDDPESGVLGVTLLKKKAILLEAALFQSDESEALRQFTVAHEIGHLVLHTSRKIREDPEAEPIRRIRDTQREFCDERKTDEPVRGWMEFQANRFAAMLLMPPRAFYKELLRVQTELEVSRKGEVWENQTNLDVVSATIKRIAGTFHTSPTTVRYQLSHLDLLHSQIPKPGVQGFFAFPE